MVQNTSQHPAYKRGYGESCLSLLSSAKNHFIQLLQHPSACSTTVVSSWDNAAAPSLFPEPTRGWRTRDLPEPTLSAGASQHPRMASAEEQGEQGSKALQVTAPGSGHSPRVSLQHETFPLGTSSVCCGDRVVAGTCKEFSPRAYVWEMGFTPRVSSRL